jgi:hypothetical protein
MDWDPPPVDNTVVTVTGIASCMHVNILPIVRVCSKEIRTKHHRTKIGAFCSPPNHLKISTLNLDGGARFPEKIGF